jgi:hypothetical protein
MEEPKTPEEALAWWHEALAREQDAFKAYMAKASRMGEYERLRQARECVAMRRRLYLKLEWDNNGNHSEHSASAE